MNKDYDENGYLESRTVEDMFRNPYNTWGGEQIEHLAREVLCRRKQWISVKDELPPHNKRCLCYFIYFDGRKQADVFEFPRFMIDYPNKFRQFNITHWMPLPEPPESEE